MNEGHPVLILGAGINGAALARELILNRVPVTIVDTADIASGTTAYSSRLVHGGLRYLEYGELDLVRQSLAERTELLHQAPHLVHALRLFIPTTSRFGGTQASIKRLLGITPRPSDDVVPRGLWLLRVGLSLYDAYARSSSLPKHAFHRITEPTVPKVDADKFRWLCSFSDAQVCYPEVLTVALLEDARQLANETDVPLHVVTYHEARWGDGLVHLFPTGDIDADDGTGPRERAVGQVRPAALVNTTGPWIDRTLQRLRIDTPSLVGGTRGSHVVTFNPQITSAIGQHGIYVEARDGRPVFILPFGSATLIGTTDLPFRGDPRTVVATEEEIDYLLRVAQDVLPAVTLSRDDVDLAYAGVRPLPPSGAHTPSSMTRRHRIEEHGGMGVPTLSLVGGKLTTCRAVAEELTVRLLGHLGRAPHKVSRGRPLPGGENYPADEPPLRWRQQRIAQDCRLPLDQIKAVWSLCGTRTEGILAGAAASPGSGKAETGDTLPGTALPREFVRWVIRNQWVTTVSDLVERRLMLLYHRQLSLRCLRAVADLLGDERDLTQAEVQSQTTKCAERLRTHFRKSLVD